MKDISEEITNEFVATFPPTRSSFTSLTARLTASGSLPEGVDPADPRVQLIEMLCMIGSRIPSCSSCRGTGRFGPHGEMCADCFGSGVLHPLDPSHEAAMIYARASRADGFPTTTDLATGTFDNQAVTYVTNGQQPLAILLEQQFLEANHERMQFADGTPLFVKRDDADPEK